MGEIADDILDGLICQCCGEWMEDVLALKGDAPFTAPGYPRTCQACTADVLLQQSGRRKKAKGRK